MEQKRQVLSTSKAANGFSRLVTAKVHQDFLPRQKFPAIEVSRTPEVVHWKRVELSARQRRNI